MDKRDSQIDQILAHLMNAASAAAGGVTDVVQTAGNVVSEKYDAMKLSLELSRLQDEQKKLFTSIGRTLYMIRSGAISSHETRQAETLDAQQLVDRFLLLADQKQLEIEHLSKRLARLNGSRVCPVCGKVAEGKDPFCPACGSKLA